MYMRPLKSLLGAVLCLISLLPRPHPACSKVIEHRYRLQQYASWLSAEGSQFVNSSECRVNHLIIEVLPLTEQIADRAGYFSWTMTTNLYVRIHLILHPMYCYVDDHSQLVLQSHNQYYSKIQLRELYWGDQTKMFAHCNYQKSIYHAVSTLNDIVICTL